MADYFVSNSGSNTSPYDTWAKAATSLQTALTAATTNGDRVIIQYNDVPSSDAELAANITYTIGANISIISASNDGGSSWTPTPMNFDYWIGNSTTSRAISFAGAFNVLGYGITLRIGANSVSTMTLAATDGAHIELISPSFWQNGGASSGVICGGTSQGGNAFVKLINPTFRFGATGQRIRPHCRLEIIGGVIDSAGAIPAKIFEPNTNLSCGVVCSGFDISACENTIIVSNATIGAVSYAFDSCKLPSSFTALDTQTNQNKSSAIATFYDCSSADVHYDYLYADPLGTLSAVTTPYFDTGAKFDGTNPVCWKIVTTANPSFATPFVTPWIEKYHSGTSAITPYLEILRNDSTAPFKNDEVWGEFSAQATAGSVLPVFKNDRLALNATGANQDNGAGLASWTGESGTAWSGKIDSGSSVTPAEIGMLRARVCVGAPNATVYVDPFIRT